MAISLRGVSNAVGQASGSATASTVSITPTLPGSAASGDRVFIVEVATSNTMTTPASWTSLALNVQVGTGAVASGSGLRYISISYRDYNGVWTMPAMALTSATNLSHWIGAVALTPSAGGTFNTPTISSVTGAFNAATTAYTNTSAASFTTHSNGFLITGTALDDNVTSTTVAITQTGATFGTVTERCDGGTGTGNIVAGKIHTAPVTTGAAATITQTLTLSAASQGETLFVEQTEIPPKAQTLTDNFATKDTAKWFYDTGASVVSSQLNQTVTSSYNSGIYSNNQYDLTGSFFSIKAVQTPNLGNGTTQAVFSIRPTPFDASASEYGFNVTNGNLAFHEKVGGTDNDTSTTYSPTTHLYWRFRESGGTVFWDTSADGVTWTNRRSKSSAWTLSSVAFVAHAGYYGTEPSPGTAIWDDINIAGTAGVNTTRFFVLLGA